MQIASKDDLTFHIHTGFDKKFFSPIRSYVDWKLQNNWDDYDELTHSLDFIYQLIRNKSWFNIHTLEKQNEVKGVLTIVSADNDDMEHLNNRKVEQTILLKYFHVVQKGAGLGSHWLRSVIMPYYHKKGYSHILVSSSHPKSFNFYRKFGSELKTFTKPSDNNKFQRICKTFLISTK